MSYQVPCPGCKQMVALPESNANERMQCSQCGMEFALQPMPIPASDADRPNTAYVPVGSAPPRLGVVYCVQCGTQYARTDDACPNCGQPVQEPIDRSSDDDRRLLRPKLQSISGFLLIVGAALMVVGAMSFIATPILAEGIFRGPRSTRFMINMVGNGMAMVLVFAAFACFLTWTYQAWRQVLRGDEDYSPGLLVGLLFVPFFNFYWMFRVIPGLSLAVGQQLKAIAPARDHSTGLGAGVAACVLALLPPAWPIALCLLVAWAFLANHAINRLIRYHEQRRERAFEEPRTE